MKRKMKLSGGIAIASVLAVFGVLPLGAAAGGEEKRTLLYFPLVVAPGVEQIALQTSDLESRVRQEVRKAVRDWRSPELSLKEIDPRDVPNQTESAIVSGDRRRLTEEFQYQCRARGADGAIAVKLEAAEASLAVVAILYLPEAIELEKLRIDINFERIPLKGYIFGGLGEFLKNVEEATTRNLKRINLRPPPPPVGKNSGGSSQTGREGEPPTRVPWPPQADLLDFSRDFFQSDRNLKKAGFVTVLDDGKMGEWTLETLQRRWAGLTTVRKLSARPVPYADIAAPTIDLDPNVDGNSIKRSLSKRGDADLLVFGHRHEETAPDGRTQVEIIMRALIKPTLDLYSVVKIVRPEDGPDRIKVLIDEAVEELTQKLPLYKQESDRSDTLAYVVVGRETLIEIAEKCYGDPNLFKALAEALGLADPNKIQKGSTLPLPRIVGNLRISERKCLSGSSSQGRGN